MYNNFWKSLSFHSIPLVGSRNLNADLRLNSQGSSINSSDTDERAAPKSVARAYSPCPVLVWTRLLIRKKNTVLQLHSQVSCLLHCRWSTMQLKCAAEFHPICTLHFVKRRYRLRMQMSLQTKCPGLQHLSLIPALEKGCLFWHRSQEYRALSARATLLCHNQNVHSDRGIFVFVSLAEYGTLQPQCEQR